MKSNRWLNVWSVCQGLFELELKMSLKLPFRAFVEGGWQHQTTLQCKQFSSVVKCQNITQYIATQKHKAHIRKNGSAREVQNLLNMDFVKIMIVYKQLCGTWQAIQCLHKYVFQNRVTKMWRNSNRGRFWTDTYFMWKYLQKA